jgi:hypothetical protein
MSNSYFDWPASLARFLRFTSAKAEDVNGALDQLSTGLDGVEADINRAVKLPDGTADQTIALTAGQRANLILRFDASGNISAMAGGGRWRGGWVTGTLYIVGDYFRDSVSKNIYSTVTQHTSGVLATDIAAGRMQLAINVVDVELAKDTAVSAAATATTQAGIATTGASTATTQAGSASASAAAAAISEAFALQATKLNLGNKATPPTVDNQGAALLAGATYYDTALNKWRVWTGSEWGDGISSIAGVFSVNGATGNVLLTPERHKRFFFSQI